jgi:hypothetical protein
MGLSPVANISILGLIVSIIKVISK